MFNDKQKALLVKELDVNRVKSRSKGNINLSYLEGFDVIDMANKIFGYGNWSYSISNLSHVSQEINQKENVVICYKALVSLCVYNIEHTNHISREDVGFGTGIAKTLADAHESAAKEAVTDSLKRALRSFGNQFGNSLYDKSKNRNFNHNHNPNQQSYQNSSQQPPNYPNNNYPPKQQNDFSQSNINNNQTTNNYQPNNHQTNNYSSLYNIGLSVVEQGDNLIVLGDDIFSKKNAIKACGFKWDGVNKIWYKKIEQVA